MRLKIALSCVFIAAIAVWASSCAKSEGTGGLASIKGKVYAYDVNDFGNKLDSGYYGGVRVYISYGENTGVDDDVRTDYNGNYQFDWLRPGNYKVWVLSDCDTCNLLQTKDLVNVEIKKRRESVEVRDLIYNF